MPFRRAPTASAGSARPMSPARCPSPITGSRPIARRWATHWPRTLSGGATARGSKAVTASRFCRGRYHALRCGSVPGLLYAGLQRDRRDRRRLRAHLQRDECDRRAHRTWRAFRRSGGRLWQAARSLWPRRLGARLCQRSGAERWVSGAAGAAPSRSTARRSPATRR